MQYISKIHAISGFIIFFAGLLQILLKKGGNIHRLIGLVYVIAWCLLLPTGAVLGSPIITMFGLLGFYSTITGYRFGHKKNIDISLFDKSIIYIGMACGIITFLFAVYLFVKSNFTFGFITLFFAFIFLQNTINDYKWFITKTKSFNISNAKMVWYFQHFNRMYASYIAAITAFTVIQNVFPLVWLNWTLPTVGGTLLLVLTNNFYKKKFKIQ